MYLLSYHSIAFIYHFWFGKRRVSHRRHITEYNTIMTIVCLGLVADPLTYVFLELYFLIVFVSLSAHWNALYKVKVSSYGIFKNCMNFRCFLKNALKLSCTQYWFHLRLPKWNMFLNHEMVYIRYRYWTSLHFFKSFLTQLFWISINLCKLFK